MLSKSKKLSPKQIIDVPIEKYQDQTELMHVQTKNIVVQSGKMVGQIIFMKTKAKIMMTIS